MDRIIIREVDNTSNIEALSSYDVAYVPGFSAGPNSSDYTLDEFYRIPTLVTDKYEFMRKFGSSAPTFFYRQPYPKGKFPEEAIKWSDAKGVYFYVVTNGFSEKSAITDSTFYTAISELITDAAGLTANAEYLVAEEDEGVYTLSLLGVTGTGDQDALVKLINSEAFTYTQVEEPTGDPAAQGWYERDGEGTSASPYLYTLTEDTSVVEQKAYFVIGAANGNVFVSATSPIGNEWYIASGSGQYTPSADTLIDPDVQYFAQEDGIPDMFNAGDADPGWRYAYTLLSMGMPVYFEQMNQKYDAANRIDTTAPAADDDITVETMYAGLINRFGIAPDDDSDDSFDSMGDYSIKFITSGGYPTFEYDDNGLATAMVNMASKRQDAIALIDHTDNPTRALAATVETSVVYKVREWQLDTKSEIYGSLFTPWFECSNPTISYNQNGTEIPNKTMPGSFAYLTALAVQLQNYNPWLAVSGVTRGKVPYCASLHTNQPLTNNIADSYQALPSDNIGQVMNISINPITYIRNYGYCIWGNRTLRNNASGTKASSFLNIRSCVADIKKRLYEASQQLLFEQNTDVLWVNFKSLILPLLETMKADYILNDFSVTRLMVDPQTGYAVPAYEVMAVIRIQPINSVEIFDLTVYLENTNEFDIQVTTTESE